MANHGRTSRRRFLQTTLGGALAAGAAPGVLGSESRSGAEHPVIGTGEHRYECHHGWGELPAHIRWGNTHGVCFDKAGLLYVKHENHETTPMDAIAVFDPTGKFVRSFGKEMHRGGHGIDIREEGGQEFLYLADIHNRKVLKTDLQGEHVWEMAYPEKAGLYTDIQQFRPTNVAFHPDGGFFVGDGYGSHYIHQYDKDAKWVRSFGGQGAEHGKFRTPHGLWLDDRPLRKPSLVVADRANARLEYYTLDGAYLSTFDDVLFPAHFDIRGDVLLVPDLHARVTLLGKDNKVIAHLGDDPAWITEVKKMKIRGERQRWLPGRFIHPHDACFDRDGNIFVAEWVVGGRLTKLRRV